MSGVFQIDREIFDSGLWTNITEFRVFFYILGNAVWKKEGIKKGNIHIKRGQYLSSYRKLREDLEYIENNKIKHYSLSNIKKIIDKLVSDERLEKEDTRLGTLFTVRNYELYQGFQRFEKGSSEQLDREQGENGERTEKEQQFKNSKKDVKDKLNQRVQSFNNDNQEQGENGERTPKSKDIENNKKNKKNKNKDTTTTIGNEQAETGNPQKNPVADIGAGPIQQDNPVKQVEDYYLTHIRKSNFCSGKDMTDIFKTYEKYQDIDFILNAMEVATKRNKARNGKITINSFNYFSKIFKEEWEKKHIRKTKVNRKTRKSKGTNEDEMDYEAAANSKYGW